MLERWTAATTLAAMLLATLLAGCAGDSANPGSDEGGAGGAAGHAGGHSGGASGESHSGGAAGHSTAGSGGAAGHSTAGSGGAAGSSGASAGATSGGAGGSAGASGCTPVTLGRLLTLDTEAGGSSLAYSVVGADATQDHVVYIEFFDVAGTPAAGSFDLSEAPDDNYSTCARCLLGFEDLGGASTPYYPARGQLVVTKADAGFTGDSAGTFEDVILVESTLSSSVTAPVRGGKCWSLGGGWEH